MLLKISCHKYALLVLKYRPQENQHKVLVKWYSEYSAIRLIVTN